MFLLLTIFLQISVVSMEEKLITDWKHLSKYWNLYDKDEEIVEVKTINQSQSKQISVMDLLSRMMSKEQQLTEQNVTEYWRFYDQNNIEIEKNDHKITKRVNDILDITKNWEFYNTDGEEIKDNNIRIQYINYILKWTKYWKFYDNKNQEIQDVAVRIGYINSILMLTSNWRFYDEKNDNNDNIHKSVYNLLILY